MKTTTQRILAIIGLILICASIVLMLVGFFAGSAKALLLNISLLCFGGSVAVLINEVLVMLSSVIGILHHDRKNQAAQS